MQTIQFGQPQPTETVNRYRIALPQVLGRGKFEIDVFNSGLKLIVMQTEAEEPLEVEKRATEPVVGFGFCSAGEFSFSSGSIKQNSVVKAGESGFFAFPQGGDIIEYLPTGFLHRTYLMLEGEFLSALAQGDEDFFSPVLKGLEKKQASRVVHSTTALMRAVLCQLQCCPYCGKTEALYLEGKAMELLSHKLVQFHPCGCHHRVAITVKSADRERIYYAAEVLTRDLENPPDITHLASKVGLSRSKLHRCFKEVYGVSPFEYLRNHRLQTAMLLLQEGEINVTQAALHVGYTNLSYFAKAFKAMFGIPPGEFVRCPASYDSLM